MTKQETKTTFQSLRWVAILCYRHPLLPNDRLKLPQVFSISRLPKIIFGEGEFKQLAREIAAVGNNILIVTGSRSFIDMPQWEELQSDLFNLTISWSMVQIKGEPNQITI